MSEEKVKLSSGVMKSVLGLDATKHSDPSTQPGNITQLRRFSQSEAKSLTKDVYTSPATPPVHDSGEGFISYLKPVHRFIGQEIIDAGKMKALAPEIDQSRMLVSSSIMSPNDLQDGEFIFSFDKVPGVGKDPELKKALSEVYSEHFNKILHLGLKSFDWIGEIQYESGSKPLLILPVATQMEIKNRTHEDIYKQFRGLGPGFASFDDAINHQSKEDEYFYSTKRYTWKDALNDKSESLILDDLIPEMESFGIPIPKSKLSTVTRKTISDEDETNYIKGLESMIVNLRTRLEEGDVIKVSENPEVLRFHTEKKLKNKQDIADKLKSKYQTITHLREPVIDLNPNPEGIPHRGHPTVIELPPESVVPIHVPGFPKEHFGYYILLDNFGKPLTIEASGMGNHTGGCGSGNVNAAYEAMFGKGVCAHSCFTSSDGSSAHAIFQHLFEKYLRKRMQGIFDRDDLQLSRFNAISTVMFQRLLENKKTTLIFVPPTLMHYLAFDYRKNGTGKSKLDDIKFILSLRTTLMMAQIMAMVNDAVEHKKIEFGLDDKAANLEMIMDLLANIFTSKSKLTGSIDPSEISDGMYSSTTTVIPKTIPGISDLSVDVQTSPGSSTRVDNELLEHLTNFLISHLDVPPAALNQMSDPEFARSLVTYNLFFAKRITRYQRIWCALIQEFVRSYTSFDPIFQNALLARLNTSEKKISSQINEKTTPEEAAKIIKKNPNKYYKNKAKLINAIIENVEVTLPSPNIVVDRTQFEEIRSFMANLDELSNHLFNSEMVPSEDERGTRAMTILRAKWKRDQMLHFIEKVGSFNMVEIPDMDDVDATEITDFLQTLHNLDKGISDHRENIGNAGADGSDGFGGESGFGDSMGDDDDGMGGDDFDDGGGGDDFGFEGGDDFSEESSSGSSSSSTETITNEDGSTSTKESSSDTYSSMYFNMYKR